MAQAKSAPQGDADGMPARELKLTCMANLLSTIEERVYFKDLESRFLFVSAGWIAAYAPGRSAEELTGKTDFDVFSYQHAADAFADEREIIQTGKPIAGQVERETYAADPDRIGQLLGSLLSNAVKFTGDGGRVEVRTAVADGQAVLTVADTGMGIPAADLERIFERFYRTAAATRQVITGTGLGLAIARAIADAHNGAISAQSTDGQGSSSRSACRSARCPQRKPMPLARPQSPGSDRPAASPPGQSLGGSPPAVCPGSVAGRRRLIAGMTEVSSALAASATRRLACCSSALTAAAASRSLMLRNRLARTRACTALSTT
jgi:hypothetical protein